MLDYLNSFLMSAKKNFNILFVAAALSYVVQMVIVPKSVTIPVVACFVVYILLYIKRKNFKVNSVPVFLRLYTPFLLWVFVSLIWTVNQDYSFALIRILLGFEYATLIGLFVKDENSFKSVLKGMVFGGIVSSITVLVLQHQYIGLSRLGLQIYGSPMEFSGGLVISCYCCIGLWKMEDNRKYLGLLVSFLVLCALSGSRSALVYPVLFLCVFLFFYHQKIVGILKVAFISIALGGLVLYSCLTIPIFYNVVGHRMETLLEDKTEDGSFMERKEMKEFALQIWKEKPLVGWGCHGFAHKYSAINTATYSHCDYTEILSCYGLIGAFLWYGPYLWVLKRKRMLKTTKHNWAQTFLISILVMFFLNLNSAIIFVNIKMVMLIALMYECLNRKITYA